MVVLVYGAVGIVRSVQRACLIVSASTAATLGADYGSNSQAHRNTVTNQVSTEFGTATTATVSTVIVRATDLRGSNSTTMALH